MVPSVSTRYLPVRSVSSETMIVEIVLRADHVAFDARRGGTDRSWAAAGSVFGISKSGLYGGPGADVCAGASVGCLLLRHVRGKRRGERVAINERMAW